MAARRGGMEGSRGRRRRGPWWARGLLSSGKGDVVGRKGRAGTRMGTVSVAGTGVWWGVGAVGGCLGVPGPGAGCLMGEAASTRLHSGGAAFGSGLAAALGRSGNAHVCLQKIASACVLAVCDVQHRPRLHVLLSLFLSPTFRPSIQCCTPRSRRFRLLPIRPPNPAQGFPFLALSGFRTACPSRAARIVPKNPLMSRYELDVPSIPSPNTPPVPTSIRRPG